MKTTTTLAVAVFGDTMILLALGAVIGAAVTMAIHNMTCELDEWRARRRAAREAARRRHPSARNHRPVVIP